MPALQKAVTGLASEIAGRATREGLSASGRHVSKETIQQILGKSKKASKLFDSHPIPVQDFQAIKHLADTGDTRLADYKAAYDEGITPIMVGITDKVTNELQEKTLKAQAQQKLMPEVEMEVDPQRQAGREWFKQGGGQDEELNKLLTKGRGKNAPQQTLEELIEEAKTSKAAKSKVDRYKSMLATGPAADEADEIVYGIAGKNPDQITRQFEGEEGYVPAFHKGTEFHHKSMKELEGEIGLKAKQLQQSGAATEDDLYDLFELGRSRGLESGSRRGAGIYAQRASHQALHQNIMLPSGIQPSATKWSNKPLRKNKAGKVIKPSEFKAELFNPAVEAAEDLGVDLKRYDLEYIKAWSENRSLEEAIAKWRSFRKSNAYDFLGPDGESEISRMVNQIKAIDNIEDLKKYKTMILDEIAEPMTKEAELLERVVSQNMTARELFEVADPQQIADLAQKVKGQEARLAEDLADKRLRKQQHAAYE